MLVTGIQDRLSYLVEMGVDVLWLSPIQDTNTVSGLDVLNWKLAKNEYGSLADLSALITAAKALGMFFKSISYFAGKFNAPFFSFIVDRY